MPKKISLMPDGIEFMCQPGQTILDAALSNDINLEYSCSNGRCGQCQATLIEGVVNKDEHSVDIELPPNGIFTCCSMPQTDISLQAHYFPQLNGIKRKTYPAKVDSLTLVNSDVLVIVLRLPPTASFKFLPGQYIDLHHSGESRSYSIASACVVEHKIELHIKKVENGLFSDLLFNQTEQGHLFRFFGPLGTFFLRENTSPLIFLCTGTGFAPVKSMVESLIEAGSDRDIHIYWGGRHLTDLYVELPYKWAEQYDNILFTPVLSREQNIPQNAMAGYVQHALVGEYDHLDNTEVYACGSEKMIHDAQVLLVNAGLNSDNFYSDAFVSSNVNL
jgi:CDP-4-dehydro-6-deoxyglucose reductase